ncbi:MAG: rhodanese-like domain-containing protein [Myxococcales bacterium]|nr:rhodanese-like domain-containing protein [Myxococcales bacterium]
MPGALYGLLMAGGLSGAFIGAFHHYVVRVSSARVWLSNGAVLVDVDRLPQLGLVPDVVALDIPLEDLPRRAHELGSRRRPVVVFAKSFFRAARAAQTLRGMGFWDVANAGGVDEGKLRASASASVRRTLARGPRRNA